MKHLTNWFCIALLAAGWARAEGAAPAVEISVADFGGEPDDEKDDTEAFRKAFAAAAQAGGPAVIRLAPGRYDFFPEKATRRACFVSNATDSANPIRTIALDLRDLSDLTLDGRGAELIMHGKMTHLAAENCRRLTLRGVSFDLARPSVSEIAVTEVGPQGWTGKVHPDSHYAIEKGKLVWVGEDWRAPGDTAQLYDPEAGTLRRVGDDALSPATSIVEESPGVLRVTTPKPIQARPGEVYQFRNAVRDQVGMWFNHCSDLVLEDVNIYAMAGFGVLSQFTENIDFERVRVSPREGSGRTCASAADIFHFSMCRGSIVVHDCVMDGAQDDAINVHGVVLKVVKKLASDRVAVQFGHPQTRGFQAYWPGDDVQFVAPSTLQPIAQAKVTKVRMEPDGTQSVTLDQPVPEEVVPGTAVLENMTWTPSVTITGCRVARIPTRGFLLTTSQPVVVRGNFFFRTAMASIFIADDAASWFESGAVRDVLIQGNTFFECASPVIDIAPENRVDGGPVHRNIRVLDNTFVLNGPAVSARFASEVVVEGNTFIAPGSPSPDSLVSRGPGAQTIQVARNVVQASDPDRLRRVREAAEQMTAATSAKSPPPDRP